MAPRGRCCPLAYRYQPEALSQPAQLEADTLFVVGGRYGNRAALQAVLERAADEPDGPATIVFNGDSCRSRGLPGDQPGGLGPPATKGNVEAELAVEGSEEEAGCGCAYPDYVGDDVVERSNQIIGRLQATAARFPELVGRLGTLPRYVTASVAGERVGILHGDPESLAGWRWPWRRWNPATRWCVARSAGAAGRRLLPSCWTGSAGPTSPSSPAPTPACRMPRPSRTVTTSGW